MILKNGEFSVANWAVG